MGLSSGQWHVRGSDVCNFQVMPLNSKHMSFPFLLPTKLDYGGGRKDLESIDHESILRMAEQIEGA